MGMQLYVQKISNPSEEWDIPSFDSSDTVEGLKTYLAFLEGPSYDHTKFHLFFNGEKLADGNTLSFYNIQKNSHLKCYQDVYVSGTFVDGASDQDVTVFAEGLYRIDSSFFNNEPQWYLDGDTNKSHLFYAGAPTIGWIIGVENGTGLNSIGCPPGVVVDSPVQLTSSDWDPSLIANGVFSTNIVISYEPISNCNPIFDRHAYGSEDGCRRFKRLRLLGYV